MNILQNRFFIGILLAAAVLFANYLGEVVWSFVVLCSALLAFKEFTKLCAALEIQPSKFWIRILIPAFILMPLLIEQDKLPYAIFICQGFLIAASFTIILLRMFLRAGASAASFQDIAASIWSILYFGFLPSFFVWIRGLENGAVFVGILLTTVALNDTAAMLIGKWLGRIPLSPQISPNKTVEGSVAGLAVGSAVFIGLVTIFRLSIDFEASVFEFAPFIAHSGTGELITLLSLGLVMSLVAQVGDLLESLFKREAGVKDSGTLLQSHGGMLDRIDSHYFAGWLAYFIFAYLIH